VNIFDNFLIFQVLQHLQAVLILQVDLWRLLPYPPVRAEGTTRWQKRDNEDVQRDNETNFSECTTATLNFIQYSLDNEFFI
jgi:hypothetical protein